MNKCLGHGDGFKNDVIDDDGTNGLYLCYVELSVLV